MTTNVSVRTTRMLTAIVGMAFGSLMLGGCVAQEEYDRLYRQIDSLENRAGVLLKERDQARAERDAAMADLANKDAALRALTEINEKLQKEILGLGGNLQDLMAQLDGLKLNALDPDTDALLRELAERYPDLITYDAAKGMLRFNSDLTFASGDDAVQPQGRQALQALASILTNSAASAYDVIVLGHTDAQQPGASRNRFPTNIHLSVARAISVRRVLVDQSVTPSKMQVAGWGEFRPAVQNTPSGNTPQNRRVEIYLTRPKAVDGVVPPAPAAEIEAPRNNTAAPAGGGTPRRPIDINK